MALSPSIGIALLARILLGAGDAAVFPAVLRLVATWFPTQRGPIMVQFTGIIGQAGQLVALVLAVALATGGPASMIAFDHARTHNPSHRLSTATGVTNAGGFIAALIAIFLIGLALDLQGAGSPETYSLDAFRIAFLMPIPLWLLGTTFILIERKRTRIRIGLDPERRR